MILLLALLAAIAIHRVWHYEDIFAPVRSSLGAKLLLDPAWSGLWIAPLTASLVLLPEDYGVPILAVLACYPPLRGLVWLHAYFNPEKKCSPCEEKRKRTEAFIKELRSFERRVVFIGADQEQANWLAQKHKTWVVLLTGSGEEPKGLWKNVKYFKLSDWRELRGIIFMGGNATFVLWNVSTTPMGQQLITHMGDMKGVSWVHVGAGLPALPEHHKAIALGESLETALT